MSQGYQIYNQNALYYLTFQIVEWVDIFTRKEYKDIAINSFNFCRNNKGLELYAYVIMSNYIHLIAGNLYNDSRYWKRFSFNQTICSSIISFTFSPSAYSGAWTIFI
jgi:REP element-mobilizing transposase RayT